MLKKVKKYLKFVICCALMLSLVAPSYAALSASDGSAFVTKSEFDSALADFNARLTTFEAGINSKIDSQVTSYLDRNGIWSGKDQDLLKTEYASGLAFPELGNNQFYSDKTTAAYLTSESSLSLKYGKNYIIDLLNENIVKCNKSGMLYLVIRIESHSVLPKDKRLFLSSTGTAYMGLVLDYGKGDGVWKTYKPKSTATTNDPVEQSKNSLHSVMGSNLLSSGEGGGVYVYYPDSMPVSASFFVDNGDNVWVRMWLQIICGGTSSTYANIIQNQTFCGNKGDGGFDLYSCSILNTEAEDLICAVLAVM